jgi:hypothetical protein
LTRQKEGPDFRGQKEKSSLNENSALRLLTALMAATLLATLAGLLVRLLLLLAWLLPAAALLLTALLLTALAALLVLLIALIGHQVTPWFDKGNNAAPRSSVPYPT